MSTKKVNFKKEVAKFSIGGTPTLSTLNGNDENEAPKSRSILSTTKLNHKNKTENDNNLITVGIRIRPLNRKELTQGYKNVIQVGDEYKKISITDNTSKQHHFECDYCFTDKNSSQSYVFECIGTPLLLRSFDGYNTSVFAYGQTGSGKTYSMIGVPQDEGIIPRFIKNLFNKISHNQDAKTQIQCEISYYEIYNEKVYDLLNRLSSETGQQQQINNKMSNLNNDQLVQTHLKVREDPITGPFIADLLKISCENENDVLLWFDIGNKRRATACTNTNDKSSRSHSVFQINLKQIKNESVLSTIGGIDGENKLQILTSKINLIDLAGSERINNLQTHHQTQSSSRFKESTCINKSLLTLGKIICLLSERSSLSSNGNSANSNSYLPYRDSLLTWLLKESLGGNSKTAMLATVNPSSHFIDETLSTLRYAAKTACIKNSAMLNRDLKYDLSELEALKEERLKSINEIEIIKQEWAFKLTEANKRKEAELANLEKSLIIFYEKEKCSKNCCLINLNEDPLLSEKLIYLIKSSNSSESTIVGCNQQNVDILISGPLIAPIHAKILKSNESNELFIEQIDKNYVTYVNGELVNERKELNHGDRIVFGGSHFFRLNNPNSLRKSYSMTPTTSGLNLEFKDYLFAKNEMENIQSKYGMIKMKELQDKYEENIEKIKSEFENEKLENKKQIEHIKCESAKKLKKIVYKNLKLETKLNILESSNSTSSTVNSNDASILSSISSSTRDNVNLQTPINTSKQDKLINKLKSELAEKLLDDHKIINEINNSIVEQHTNLNSKFSLTLKLNEMNKICNLLKFNYEFKLHEIYNTEKRSFLQIICCLNKLNNLAMFLNLDQFDEKLMHLRFFYSRFMEENEIPNEETLFWEQNTEWQNLDDLLKSDLSPTVSLDNVVNKAKPLKRRLSLNNTEEQIDQFDLIGKTPTVTSIDMIDQNYFKRLKTTDNDHQQSRACAKKILANIRNFDVEETKAANADQNYNILDDNVFQLCNQLIFYLNDTNEETLVNVAAIASHFYLLIKYLKHEVKNRELLREFSEIVDNFLINLNNYLDERDSSHLKFVKNDINKILKINGQLKFYNCKNVIDCSVVAIFDYQNKFMSLNLTKYYLFGLYVEYNQFIKDFIVSVKNNYLYSFNDNVVQFMDIFILFKGGEYESLIYNNDCENDDSILMQNFINYANYMLKTHKSLNEILKILNENDFKKNKNLTYSALVQNFDSILTDTIQIQIINQSFNKKTSLIIEEEEDEEVIQNDRMNNEYIDKLIDAFKNLKISFKTFFKNNN